MELKRIGFAMLATLAGIAASFALLWVLSTLFDLRSLLLRFGYYSDFPDGPRQVVMVTALSIVPAGFCAAPYVAYATALENARTASFLLTAVATGVALTLAFCIVSVPYGGGLLDTARPAWEPAIYFSLPVVLSIALLAMLRRAPSQRLRGYLVLLLTAAVSVGTLDLLMPSIGFHWYSVGRLQDATVEAVAAVVAVPLCGAISGYVAGRVFPDRLRIAPSTTIS